MRHSSRWTPNSPHPWQPNNGTIVIWSSVRNNVISKSSSVLWTIWILQEASTCNDHYYLRVNKSFYSLLTGTTWILFQMERYCLHSLPRLHFHFRIPLPQSTSTIHKYCQSTEQPHRSHWRWHTNKPTLRPMLAFQLLLVHSIRIHLTWSTGHIRHHQYRQRHTLPHITLQHLPWLTCGVCDSSFLNDKQTNKPNQQTTPPQTHYHWCTNRC